MIWILSLNGRLGYKRRIIMYRYVEDKKFVSRMRNVCGEIMQDLCHNLSVDYGIGSVPHLVGSGKRKLITQNNSNPVDLDYNLEIVTCENFKDCRAIKEAVRKSFNKALSSHGLNDCQDSTSSLTTNKMHFTNGNSTEFSIDVCIVCLDNEDNLYRLIHDKTGFTYYDSYNWDISPNSAKLCKKADCIKRSGKWQSVRDQYITTKNTYLQRNDYNHPSFICYLETVNNVYNSMKNGGK